MRRLSCCGLTSVYRTAGAEWIVTVLMTPSVRLTLAQACAHRIGLPEVFRSGDSPDPVYPAGAGIRGSRQKRRAELFRRTHVAGKKLARRAEFLLECAAMSAAIKQFVLMMMMMALPLQGLAAVFVSVCKDDPTHGSSVVKSYHQHADKHAHDAPAPDHDHPLAANDCGSDHCGTGSAVAVPMTAAWLPATPSSEHSLFLATSISGHVPEQPQRPPRAILR